MATREGPDRLSNGGSIQPYDLSLALLLGHSPKEYKVTVFRCGLFD
jgi:hypothetical protein